MITPQTIITIYNENKGKVYCDSLGNQFGYTFEAMEDGIPFEIPMPFSDIKYNNSRSSIFRDGLLKIDPSMEDEVFKMMGVASRSDNYIECDEIKDIIINPTTEKLERILKINSIVTMDKIRNILVELNNSDEYFIAETVYKIINARYAEICAGKRKSDIQMKPKKNETPSKVTASEETQEINEVTEENKTETIEKKKTTTRQTAKK